MSRIRLLLVEDQTLFRESLHLLLETQPDFEVVGEAADGLAGLERAQALQPDVVVMDLTMPGMDGLEATRLLKNRYPDIQILALTGAHSEQFFFQALQAGASGYVVKSVASAELIAAVQAVARGEVFLHAPVARKLAVECLQRARSGQQHDGYNALTDREREVLQLMAEGFTNQEIAARLNLSPNTVHTHRMHVMEKLGLRTRADLVKYAVRKGLLWPGSQSSNL